VSMRVPTVGAARGARWFRGDGFMEPGMPSGVPGLLRLEDEIHHERRAAEDLVPLAQLEPMATDLLHLEALQVGDDVRRRRPAWHLDVELRRPLQEGRARRR